ncbi:Tetratricopeptide repeat family [Synechococcus sp. PCC 7335]|uniref:CHAT domain-containing tetratricopeptide repeat protein n=1 Tax=Synechococcus sp. (strain ATCC 29403 / PCC 7335) TaxID=91464 RepID=UPI00017EC027|nr:CHAT domain-containing tetratricopeptide repeat protein [Synechococcus sp. PCC 7335]EDX84369.1 Tetratricopeptide repeat family [Synechococcus sp. PCC 7335]
MQLLDLKVDISELNSDELARADELSNQVVALYQEERYEEAIPFAEEVIAIRERAIGDDHRFVADSLSNLGALHDALNNYAEAITAYERALTIYETALGEKDPTIAEKLNILGNLYTDSGNYAKAQSRYEQALSIREEILEENHLDTAISLDNLATLYWYQGSYLEAIPLYERALAIRETLLGGNHPDVADVLNGLGAVHRALGKYEIALPLYDRALAIKEAALGPDHLAVATTLNSLALLYQDKGDYEKSLQLHKRALAIREKSLDEDHFEVGNSLHNLAVLYYKQYNYDDAAPLFVRAIEIFKVALGENHPIVAAGLSNAASVYREQELYQVSRLLYERALEIRELTLGENHPHVAVTLNSLGTLYQDQGDYELALPLYERALSINRITFGEDHPAVADSLNRIGVLYNDQGETATALDLYEQSTGIYKAILGENHPDVAINLNNIASLQFIQGNHEAARSLYRQTLQIEEQNLSDLFLGASEIRIQQYIKQLLATTNLRVSFSLEDFNAAGKSDQADTLKLALTNVLQRKGRVLEAAAVRFEQIRANLTAENQQRLDELSDVRTEIAKLRFEGLGNRSQLAYQSELDRLTDRAEILEDQLARSSAAFRLETLPVSVDAIQPLIPQNAALVEFVRYSPYAAEPKIKDRWQAPRYAAYVLTQDEINAVDLGVIADIDPLVLAFRAALSSRSAKASAIARQLDEKLIAPLRPFLNNKEQLLLSPDSQLNLIPFDALIDNEDSYLIETYQISYLSSGRDLLKLQTEQPPSQQPPLILANPDYASASKPQNSLEQNIDRSRRSVDASGLVFSPLPGTAQEAEAIATLLPEATTLTQARATEASLKQVNAPSILHIATHGFFLPDVEFIPPASSERRRDSRSGLGASFSLVETKASQTTPSNLENPLLRSGLALAGANRRSSGAEDGIFTALEASSLKLNGTQLVVLSACETGVGAVSNGEGVYGLRRTFAIAGAQSQLMSLWQVGDIGTSELMELYYKNLIEKKQGRSEALRNAQLELLNTGTYRHPYYWSSFILSGDWRPLD